MDLGHRRCQSVFRHQSPAGVRQIAVTGQNALTIASVLKPTSFACQRLFSRTAADQSLRFRLQGVGMDNHLTGFVHHIDITLLIHKCSVDHPDNTAQADIHDQQPADGSVLAEDRLGNHYARPTGAL